MAGYDKATRIRFAFREGCSFLFFVFRGAAPPSKPLLWRASADGDGVEADTLLIRNYRPCRESRPIAGVAPRSLSLKQEPLACLAIPL